MLITLYERPGRNNSVVVQQITDIASKLTEGWFTEDVPGWLANDLLFQDVICAEEGNMVIAFIMFTSIEGVLNITLMGTEPTCRNQSYGSRLMEYFVEYAKVRGFRNIELLTVPPERRSSFRSTLAFYAKHGFVRVKEYPDVWDTGALKLAKTLQGD